jgi:hypothetical protein
MGYVKTEPNCKLLPVVYQISCLSFYVSKMIASIKKHVRTGYY